MDKILSGQKYSAASELTLLFLIVYFAIWFELENIYKIFCRFIFL